MKTMAHCYNVTYLLYVKYLLKMVSCKKMKVMGGLTAVRLDHRGDSLNKTAKTQALSP